MCPAEGGEEQMEASEGEGEDARFYKISRLLTSREDLYKTLKAFILEVRLCDFATLQQVHARTNLYPPCFTVVHYRPPNPINGTIPCL